MAGRIRSIKPEILDDDTALDLSDTAWRLWVSSWVLADDHGLFRASLRYLAGEVWKDSRRIDDAEKAMDELVRAGMVRRYEVDGELFAQIKPAGWKRHQRIDHPGKPRMRLPSEGEYLDPEHRRSRAGRPVSVGRQDGPGHVPIIGDVDPNDSNEIGANPREGLRESRESSRGSTREAETLGSRVRARDPVGGRRSVVPAPDPCQADLDSAPSEREPGAKPPDSAPADKNPNPPISPDTGKLTTCAISQADPKPTAKPPRRASRKPSPQAGPLFGDDLEPKPETAVGVAWRTWRAEYERVYRRKYPRQTADGDPANEALRGDGHAMNRAAKLAVDLLAELGRPASDLETLLVHRWRKYLADTGRRQPDGKFFLRDVVAHALQHFELGLAAYGTPWDRDTKLANGAHPEQALPAIVEVKRVIAAPPAPRAQAPPPRSPEEIQAWLETEIAAERSAE